MSGIAANGRYIVFARYATAASTQIYMRALLSQMYRFRMGYRKDGKASVSKLWRCELWVWV